MLTDVQVLQLSFLYLCLAAALLEVALRSGWDPRAEGLSHFTIVVAVLLAPAVMWWRILKWVVRRVVSLLTH